MSDLITIGEPPGGQETPERGNREGSVATAFRDRYDLEGLRTENAGLDEAARELVKTLELRERRVNQLLGERNQLERQLVRAEAALQELNRKLGAAARPEAVPAAPTSRLQPTLRDRLLGSLSRLRTRQLKIIASPRAQAQEEDPIRRDRWGPLISFAGQREARVIALVAFGLKAEQRTHVLDIALRFGVERGVVPLVLTDDDDFAPLRSRGMVFEYFPPRSVREARAPALEWELYLQRRLALIRRKWRPTRIIAFGGQAAEAVRLWSESPFEDASLGRLPVAERPAGAPSPRPR
jgi:hypothetical protein